VKIKPGSKGKEIISVGDRHISYSSDFGKTWKKISDEKGFFCEWINENTLFLQEMVKFLYEIEILNLKNRI
jgi:dTDP-4-dehydrorhamnose 3,5-epimerase-like enzyme